MLVRIYQLMWALAAVAAGIFWISGNFNMLSAVVFGFVCFGLVFMGMISVLPATVAHPESVRHDVTPGEREAIKQQASVLEHFHAFKKEFIPSEGVEIRRPKFH